jgi:hypothetical protein
MKLVLFIFILSFSAFAESRIPTNEESKEIDKLINSNNSLSQLIKLIENDTIDPMYSWFDGTKSTAGESTLFYKTVYYRFDPIKGYKGDLEENLKLINLLVSKGLNVNTIQPANLLNGVKQLPITSASNTCSIDLLNILLNNGMNIDLDKGAWLSTLGISLNVSNDILKKNCQMISEFYLKNTNGLSLDSIFDLFASSDDDLTFSRGDMVHKVLSVQSLTSISEKYGVNFNKEPIGSLAPSDEWFARYLEVLDRPMQNTNFKKSEVLALTWWNEQSDDLKQWSCYYSTFNEVYDLLVANDANKDLLLNFPASSLIGKKYRGFGNFAIDVFRPYCNSLK